MVQSKNNDRDDLGSVENLDNLRKNIDNIDDKILELLASRSRIVDMMGKIKTTINSKSKNSIIRPGREASMIRRITNKNCGAFSKAAIAQLWRLIIASSIMIEENTRVAALSPQQNTECFWLAREYFGSFTPIAKHSSTADVLNDVVKGNATVGVIPIWDDNSPMPWWVRLTEVENAPRVFAKLPFIKQAPSQKSPLVAFGYINPEPTGDDQSLWGIKSDEKIPFELIEPGLKESFGSDVEVIDHFRQIGEKTKRCYLLQIADFVDIEDKRMEKFVKSIKSRAGKDTEFDTFYVGAYATPIVLLS